MRLYFEISIQILREVDFEDYRDAESGEVVFHKFGPHKTVQLMAKKL